MTGKIADEELEEIAKRYFPITPKEIIDYLDLKKPIYKSTASYGHFGREEEGFTWEERRKVEELKRLQIIQMNSLIDMTSRMKRLNLDFLTTY